MWEGRRGKEAWEALRDRENLQMRSIFSYSIFLFLLLFLVPLPLRAGGGEKGAAFDLASLLSHHLMDSVIWEWNIGGEKVHEGDARFDDSAFLRRYSFRDSEGSLYKYSGGIPMHLTRRVVQMMILSLLLILLLSLAARRISRNPYRIAGPFSNMLESIFQWCKRDIIEPSMHGHAKGFSSYILTLFFFILFLNLGGLFPPIGEGIQKLWYGFFAEEGHRQGHGQGSTESAFIALWPGITVTGDISVTFALALLTAVMIWVTGFRCQGPKYLWRVVPNGVPVALFPLLWPLEFIVGPLAKGFALSIRLLANMTAGHVIILALMGFIFQSASLWYGGLGSALGALSINLASLSGVLAIYFLEIMVAFLQAFIFTLLTALFVGSAIHRH